MNNYSELKKKHEKELNLIPHFFAIGEAAFNKGLLSIGLTENDKDKVIPISAGKFIKKADLQVAIEIEEMHRIELAQAIQNDSTGEYFIFSMFNLALSDYEYFVREDPTEALNSLGLSIRNVREDKKLLRGYEKAIDYQRTLHFQQRTPVHI